MILLVNPHPISRDEMEFAIEHSDSVSREYCEDKRLEILKELRCNSIETARARNDIKHVIYNQRKFDEKLDAFLVQHAIKKFILRHKNKIMGILVALASSGVLGLVGLIS